MINIPKKIDLKNLFGCNLFYFPYKRFARKIIRDTLGMQEINYVDIKGNNKKKLMDKHDYTKDSARYNSEAHTYALNINNYPLNYGASEKMESTIMSPQSNANIFFKNKIPDQPGGQENPDYHSFKKGGRRGTSNRSGHRKNFHK